MEEELDRDLASLRSRVAELEAQRTNLTTILFSSPHIATRLQQRPATRPGLANKALKVVQKQAARNQENIYRTCAGITAYKVRDPDPNALDGGNVLGVQIEVASKGTFLPPYHVLFVRPDSREQMKTVLKIHRHTIPTAIPLAQLAAKYLPQPQKGLSEPPVQDLDKFLRCLRKELMSYTLRKAVVGTLRAEAGLSALESEKENVATHFKALNAIPDSEDEESDDSSNEMTDQPSRKYRPGGPHQIVDISSSAPFREITIDWSDGQVAKLTLDKDGQIEKGVVRTGGGSRVADIERAVVGRVEGLIERLSAK